MCIENARNIENMQEKVEVMLNGKHNLSGHKFNQIFINGTLRVMGAIYEGGTEGEQKVEGGYKPLSIYKSSERQSDNYHSSDMLYFEMKNKLQGATDSDSQDCRIVKTFLNQLSDSQITILLGNLNYLLGDKYGLTSVKKPSQDMQRRTEPERREPK